VLSEFCSSANSAKRAMTRSGDSMPEDAVVGSRLVRWPHLVLLPFQREFWA